MLMKVQQCHLKWAAAFFWLITGVSLEAQEVIGKWRTIDDETEQPKSIVEIFERDGKIYGKLIKLFRTPEQDQDPVCSKCEEDDPRFNKKFIGMEIMTDMSKVGDEYTNGEILDPGSGKIYKCKMWLDGADLKVRGYWGPFYRTQTWLKAL